MHGKFRKYQPQHRLVDDSGAKQNLIDDTIDAEHRAPNDDARCRAQKEGNSQGGERQQLDGIVLAALGEPESKGEGNQQLDNCNRAGNTYRTRQHLTAAVREEPLILKESGIEVYLEPAALEKRNQDNRK